MITEAANSGYINHYQGDRQQDRRTPRKLFDQLNAKYGFTMDGAADTDNALLDRYSSQEDPLSWVTERVFCNPPWSSIKQFVEMAPDSEFACLLVPARVNSRWFHRALELGARVEFFEGRPNFAGRGKKSGSPFDCLLLLWGK